MVRFESLFAFIRIVGAPAVARPASMGGVVSAAERLPPPSGA
jgi:hypothetical protein